MMKTQKGKRKEKKNRRFIYDRNFQKKKKRAIMKCAVFKFLFSCYFILVDSSLVFVFLRRQTFKQVEGIQKMLQVLKWTIRRICKQKKVIGNHRKPRGHHQSKTTSQQNPGQLLHFFSMIHTALTFLKSEFGVGVTPQRARN